MKSFYFNFSFLTLHFELYFRRGAESNRRIQVLQTRALPLCYRAELLLKELKSNLYRNLAQYCSVIPRLYRAKIEAALYHTLINAQSLCLQTKEHDSVFAQGFRFPQGLKTICLGPLAVPLWGQRFP